MNSQQKPNRSLDKMERMFALSGRLDPFNIAATASFEGMPADWLWAAAESVAEAVPALWTALDEDRQHWLMADEPPIAERTAIKPRSLVEAGLTYHFQAGSALIRLWVNDTDPEHPVLVVIADHAFCDAVSLLRIIHLIAERAVGDHTGTLQAPVGTAHRSLASDTRQPPAKTFLSDMALQARYRFKRKHKPNAAEGCRARVVHYELPAPISSALISRARKQKLTINALLQAAHLQAVGKALETDGALMGMTFSNLRSAYEPAIGPGELGAAVGLIPYCIDRETTLWDAAEAVQEQIIKDHREMRSLNRVAWMAPIMRQLQNRGGSRLCDMALSWSDRLPRWYHSHLSIKAIEAYISPTRLGPVWSCWAQRSQQGIIFCGSYLSEHLTSQQANALAVDVIHRLTEARSGP